MLGRKVESSVPNIFTLALFYGYKEKISTEGMRLQCTAQAGIPQGVQSIHPSSSEAASKGAETKVIALPDL